jgi:lipopolysaccharide export system protein LptC
VTAARIRECEQGIMAIQSRSTALTRFRGLPQAADRTRAFRAAVRHSALVRFLRVALPLAAVAVSALYMVPGEVKFAVGGGEATAHVDLTSEGLKMINPRIRGVHDTHGTYDVRAEYATQNVKHPELVSLHKITADLVSNDGQKTTMTAPSGLYHSKKEELTFDRGVTIGGESGITGELKTATAFFQNHVLISPDTVELSFHDSTIHAQAMTLYTSESRVVFTGDVRVHLERAPKEGGK